MTYRARLLSESVPSRQRKTHYLQASPTNYARKSLIQRPIIEKPSSQYQLIVEFQLRRQKQKTLILEERLRNKQSFIKQMKEFQDQLTLTYQKCQQQLILCQQDKQKLQQQLSIQAKKYESQKNDYSRQKYQEQKEVKHKKTLKDQSYNTFNMQQYQLNRQIPLSTNQAREYLQQIAQLKHLVIRLQQQINMYQKKQLNHSNIKPHKNQRMITQGFDQFQISNRQDRQSHKKRSKTLANQAYQKSATKEQFSNTQKEIVREKHKIASFINHFLTMVQFFQSDLLQQGNLKQKLKKAWKWVKNVMVEWNHLKNQNTQKIKCYKLGNIVNKFLPSNLSAIQTEQILQRVLRPFKQY